MAKRWGLISLLAGSSFTLCLSSFDPLLLKQLVSFEKTQDYFNNLGISTKRGVFGLFLLC